MCPLARSTDLLIEDLPSETIVYDTKSHRAHCLNQTAGFILRHCDGHTSVEQLAELLSQTFAIPAHPDIVRTGLAALDDCHLLVGKSAALHAVSRREMTKRLSALGGAALALLPVATSIVAPTPAMARSNDDHGKGRGKKKGHRN